MQLPASLSAQLPSWLHSSLQQLGSRSLTALALVPAGPAAASPRLPRWLQYSLLGLGAVVAASQLWWLGLRWRFGLPAPLLRPLLGINALLEMVMDPVGYWDRRAAHAHADRSGRGMSLDLLLGHPLIFVTDNKLSQKVSGATIDRSLGPFHPRRCTWRENQGVHESAPATGDLAGTGCHQ